MRKNTVNKDLDSILSEYLKEETAVVPNLQLPDPDLITFYKEDKDRVLWLSDQVDQDTMLFVKKIMLYNLQDKDIPVEERKPIKLFIDTNGGSVVVMWSLIQAIKVSKTPVYTINFCAALSAGAHILASGHKRFAFPGSYVLIHSGSCQYSGTQEQAESAKKYYDKITEAADDQLLADTKIEKKMLKKKSPFDWYLTTDEALQYGIVDKIITDYTELI